MARKGKGNQPKAEAYRHDDTRKNIPEAGLVDYVRPAADGKAKKEYCWDPRESPQLIWAGKAGMNRVEVEEQASLEVPVANLHIHERVSAEAILRSVRREDAQRSLFADPELEFKDEIKFYQHDVDWSNRMILGDSLLVMNSLLEREGMRGQVQCIYMDPPYGIKYASNFQPKIDQRDVKDGKDDDLTREVMQVQAFRDTWELGIHSYLTYMRDRLLVARELLADTGSIFVQIGDENVHRVRCLMDEVFGEPNFVSQIAIKKTIGLGSSNLTGNVDYLLWFAKDKARLKYRPVMGDREIGEGTGYTLIEMSDGSYRRMTREELDDTRLLPKDGSPFCAAPLMSSGYTESCTFDFEFQGRKIQAARYSWKTTPQGVERLKLASRIVMPGQRPNFKLLASDYPVEPMPNYWGDVRASDVVYAVQTANKVLQRSILMTTDPGDLVLDPTCGSGTTAYVAEQWGRRWITMDTSRVALAIARHRLMTAAFDYYKLRHPESGVSGGFRYKTVPHITLKSIAQNTEIDEIAADMQGKIDYALQGLAAHTKREWKEWEVPREADPAWNQGAKHEHRLFWELKREMQARIDASIAKNAPTEELVDQPEKEPGIVRVSGPFTMEAVPNVSADISTEVSTEVIPGDGAELEVNQFVPAEIRRAAENAESYITNMIEAMRKTGVHGKGGKKIDIENVRKLEHEFFHAEAEMRNGNGGRRVAVLFGPQNGAVTETLARDAMNAGRKYEAILFCGYDFTSPAQEMIQAADRKDWRMLISYINPDTAMADLLKDTKASQIFTLIGEPDIVVYSADDPALDELLAEADSRGAGPEVRKRAEGLEAGEMFIELRGVDLYDPVSGEVQTDSGANVHAVFIDHDYDGKSFCICQALFPNKKDSWAKIARNLRGAIDEEAFEAMRTQVSLPFKPGGKVQVKVIDTRGNAVVKTVGGLP